MSKRLLAKYDFRSKQQYIYRTNKVKEIVGASELITQAYSDFFDVLGIAGIHVDNGIAVNGICPKDKPCAFDSGEMLRYINNPKLPFDPEFGDDLDGKIIYIGGGNLYMLWRNVTIAETASGILCKMLRENAYSLSAICGMTEYSGDYSSDMKNLNDDFERCKVVSPPFLPTAMLPFTELDRRTSLPVAHKAGKNGSKHLQPNESVSEESFLKRRQYKASHGDKVELLDNMITEKGRESLLAVIYIDGNNMGVRVAREMNPNDNPITDYTEGVRTIRALSNSIQESFVSVPRKAINEAAKSDERMKDKIRWIVSGGDEITLICNARAALDVVRLYFQALAETGKENTACAGIAVFHSHFPFAKAYAVAEECCENAKKLNRRNGSNNSLVDFQFIYAGVTGDLKSMRKQDGRFMARPYLVSGTVPRITDDFILRAERLKKIGRANIKNLSSRLFGAEEEYMFDVERLNAQYSDVELKKNYAEDRKFILDIAQFYDIWFSEEVK